MALRLRRASSADRYARQVALAGVGAKGQRRIRKARILVVGLGGLGCPAAAYLAGAGVGRLGLCDFDTVELSNLPRQPLYAAADVGRPKVEAARDHLASMNPDVDLALHPEALDAENALRTVRGYDVAVDGTDSLEARDALNAACLKAKVPWVQAGIAGWEAQVAVFVPGGPCYRCLHPTAVATGPTCAEEGVLGPLPGVAGTLQAVEALKLVLGLPTLAGRVLLWDAKAARWDALVVARRPDCPACGKGRRAAAAPEVDVAEARRLLAGPSPPLVVDVRTGLERRLDRLDGSLHLPMGALDEARRRLPAGRPLLVHCAVGMRSRRAARRLRELGFDAVSLRGGLRAWRRAERRA
ncbi:MAG TPA: HesA/MoeB/ThiF family protein [Candidatus Thermoplasmatota archaeon]|nr:HesA/MoeB/ThiF family protein [Candidatus Thermoplasmatota archaeon]